MELQEGPRQTAEAASVLQQTEQMYARLEGGEIEKSEYLALLSSVSDNIVRLALIFNKNPAIFGNASVPAWLLVSMGACIKISKAGVRLGQ